MALGSKYDLMKETYGGDWTRYLCMISFFARFLYYKYYHRLMGRSMEYFATNVNDCREKIWRCVCFDNEGNQNIDVPLEHFRLFGFIDCMTTSTCMPGSGPINENQDRVENTFEIQRAFFTSYGKKWGMKIRAIYLPNGMVSNVFFTAISQNNNGLIKISGIEEELERVLQNYKLSDYIFQQFMAMRFTLHRQ